MTLDKIIIYGASNQAERQTDEGEPTHDIAKLVQVYYRQRLTSEVMALTVPIFERIRQTGQISRDALLERFEPPPFYLEDYGVRFRRRQPTAEEMAEDIRKKELERKKQKQALLSYDYDTYQKLYKDLFPKLAYNIMKEGGNTNIARDLFQNALIILLEQLKSEAFELTADVETYLYSVTMNIYRNLRRQLASRVIHVDIDEYAEELRETIYFEEIPGGYAEVAAILEKMGNPCKGLMESFYFNRLSWEAIAEKFGYATAASARNQKYKCIQRIREELDRRKGGE